MNPRLSHIAILLLGLMLTMPAVGGIGVTKSSGKRYSVPSGIPGGHMAAGITAIDVVKDRPGLPLPDHDDKEFRAAPDVAMHGSVTAVCDASLSLIGIIHLHESEAFPPTVNRPTQQVLFRILFRQIISPNAP